MQVLAQQEWQARAAAHAARVDAWTRAHLERRAHGQTHAVEDFLFDYYPFRPGQLRRWHPGAGVVLAGPHAAELLDRRWYVRVADGVTVDVEAVLEQRADDLAKIGELLTRTAERPPQLGCFGLHEWAMVHGSTQSQVRHPGTPLRMSVEDTASVVARLGLRCTHFDAFRFFTSTARPLNLLQPTRATQPELEQPGCLHANMDLYRWAYQLLPLVPSELVGDAFALARDIRAVDMRASPYDLAELGYPAIEIETPAGRAEYAAAQRLFAERAEPIRRALIALIELIQQPRQIQQSASSVRT